MYDNIKLIKVEALRFGNWTENPVVLTFFIKTVSNKINCDICLFKYLIMVILSLNHEFTLKKNFENLKVNKFLIAFFQFKF